MIPHLLCRNPIFSPLTFPTTTTPRKGHSKNTTHQKALNYRPGGAIQQKKHRNGRSQRNRQHYRHRDANVPRKRNAVRSIEINFIGPGIRCRICSNPCVHRRCSTDLLFHLDRFPSDRCKMPEIIPAQPARCHDVVVRWLILNLEGEKTPFPLFLPGTLMIESSHFAARNVTNSTHNYPTQC